MFLNWPKKEVTRLYTLYFMCLRNKWLNVKFFYVCWRLPASFFDNTDYCNCSNHWNWYHYACNASTTNTRFLTTITFTSTAGRIAIASWFVTLSGFIRRGCRLWTPCVTGRFSTIVSQITNSVRKLFSTNFQGWENNFQTETLTALSF